MPLNTIQVSILLAIFVCLARLSNNFFLKLLAYGATGLYFFPLIHNALQAVYRLIPIAN
jgi:hypothetical protein